MSVNIQVFEETGAIAGGRGSVVTEITNINWKSSADPAAAYYLNPVKRPSLFGYVYRSYIGWQTFSYKRYVFFKVSGDYEYLKNFKIIVEPTIETQASGYSLFYKMSNEYVEPTNEYDGSMICLFPEDETGKKTLLPMISTVSPNLATTRPLILGPNQTFYTNYFVSQMRVNHVSDWQDVGNTPQYNFKFVAHEFE